MYLGNDNMCFFIRISIVFCFFSTALFAQHFIDTFHDKTFFYEYSEAGNQTIYQLSIDGSLERIRLPIPESTDLAGNPRPKNRFDNVWMSNRNSILFKPLTANISDKWESIKLPDGLGSFFEFDVISESEILILGAIWQYLDKNGNNDGHPLYDEASAKPIRHDIHFIYDHQNGATTKVIEAFDPEKPVYGFEHIIKRRSFTSIFNSNLIIADLYSGFMTIMDIDTRKTKKYEVVSEKELPIGPDAMVNNGTAIAWVSPLAGNEVLICYRLFGIPPNKPNNPVIIYAFKILNLDSGKLTPKTNFHRGHEAQSHLTLFEENGELVSVRDFIKERAFVPKPKQTEDPPQPNDTEITDNTEEPAATS
jgi:hypothetical protein